MTQCPRGVLIQEVIDDLRCIFTGLCIDLKAVLVTFDDEDDYVHLMVNYPPKVGHVGAPELLQRRTQ